MRKQLRFALIASAALMMLATGPSWAQQTVIVDATTAAKPKPKPSPQAPEINVGAGGAGLTVLAIALLLAAEKRSHSS